MSRVSVGVIGFGRMGRIHARVLSEASDTFELVGIFDPNRDGPDAGRAVRFPNALSLIEASALVIVAAPTPHHGSLVCAALERGRAVLVEKPIAATTLEAQRLADLADARGCPLFVGHSERFHPVVREIRARLRATPNRPAISILIDRVVPGAAVAGSDASREDVVMNLGVHDLDLVEQLTGTRAVVLGATGDASSSRLQLSAGLTVATLRCCREGERKRTVRVTTAETIMEGDLLSPRLRITDRLARRSIEVSLPSEEPLRAQAFAIHAALLAPSGSAPSNEARAATGRDGARAVELAELAMTLRDRKRGLIAHESAQT